MYDVYVWVGGCRVGLEVVGWNQGEGVDTMGNPKDSVWEDWGTLGNHHPNLKNPIIYGPNRLKNENQVQILENAIKPTEYRKPESAHMSICLHFTNWPN